MARHTANYLINHPTDLAMRFTRYGNRATNDLILTILDYQELVDARDEVLENLNLVIINDRTRHHNITTERYLTIMINWFRSEYLKTHPEFIFEMIKG